MKNKLIIILLFASAMALLESAVVVYLRELYFPAGFAFPIPTIEGTIASIEFWREVATLIMLFAVGWLAGHNFMSRLGWFLVAFGIWDIFYYIFLFLFLGWPTSLWEWDILFLVPFPWVGPVICPVLISIVMIIWGAFCASKIKSLYLFKWQTLLLLVGSGVCIFSFCEEYLGFLYNNDLLDHFITLVPGSAVYNHSPEYLPTHFSWLLFASGFTLILTAVSTHIFHHTKKSNL